MIDPPTPDPRRAPLTSEERESARASLCRDVEIALLSEFGARAITDHLSRKVRDDDLRRMALHLNDEGIELVVRVQQLVRELGGEPRRTSVRRRVLARALVAGRRVLGLRVVLRMLQAQEESLSRWYGDYAQFLARIGEPALAVAFDELRDAKFRRSQTVATWVENMPRRMR